MGAYYLAEITVELIQAQIKSKIASALAAVRLERDDPVVTTEPPKEYFTYATSQTYRPPAIFTIMEGQNFRNSIAHNHINALDSVLVAVVVEDRLERLVVKKAWRYQAALMQCLHLVTLTNTDGSVKLFSRVEQCKFSGLVNIKNASTPENVFRKEMSLALNIEHIENLE